MTDTSASRCPRGLIGAGYCDCILEIASYLNPTESDRPNSWVRLHEECFGGKARYFRALDSSVRAAQHRTCTNSTCNGGAVINASSKLRCPNCLCRPSYILHKSASHVGAAILFTCEYRSIYLSEVRGQLSVPLRHETWSRSNCRTIGNSQS